MLERKIIKIFCIVGFLFVCVLGTVSHFFYFWSGKKKIVGIFFPVNESTWEHLKLSIFPTLFFFGIGAFFITSNSYAFALFITLLIPMVVIPIIFYSYTCVLKKSILLIDILTFYVSVAISWIASFLILNSNLSNEIINVISYVGIAVIILFYLTFTLHPPKIFLFKDPISGEYGF